MKKILLFLLTIIFILISIPNTINAEVVGDNYNGGGGGDGTYGYLDTGVESDYDIHWGNGEDGYID